MRFSFKALKGFKFNATDHEEVGELKDVLFDDRDYRIRFLVAKCGSWLSGDTVLISPFTMNFVNPAKKSIDLSLSKETLESCPSRSRTNTVSESLLNQMQEYYPFSDPYFGFAGWTHVRNSKYSFSPNLKKKVPASTVDPSHIKNTVNHLRSLKKLVSYKVITPQQDEVGKIQDAIVDLKGGRIRHLVVDTGSWLRSKEFLVPNGYIASIDSRDRCINTSITKSQIEHCPPYDANQMINHEVEVQLYDYYGRPLYWPQDTKVEMTPMGMAAAGSDDEEAIESSPHARA